MCGYYHQTQIKKLSAKRQNFPFFKKQRTILNKFYFSTMKLLTVTSQRKNNVRILFCFNELVFGNRNYCYPYSYFLSLIYFTLL